MFSNQKLTLLGKTKSPAKINLSLDVLWKRPDGYHELRGLMAKVRLYDTVSIFHSKDQLEDGLEFSNQLGPPFEQALERDKTFNGPGNLALKALRAFRAKTGYPKPGAVIGLDKAIPKGAGLGGGSSNAAAVLRILNRAIGLSEPELKLMGKDLGGDVPFFLDPNTFCWIGGIGDRLKAYHFDTLGSQVLLINPGVELSTAEVFRHLDLTFSQNGSINLTAPSEPYWGPGFEFSFDSKLAGLENGADDQEIRPSWGINSLEDTALRLCPELGPTREKLLELKPPPTCIGLSGSGPTYWAIYQKRPEAQAALTALAPSGLWVRLVTFER
ncbi:MAG: hypothetical protein LBE80_09745 [Deltaproteobacteria bacterium]|jgi:4-diphosphocytidyl-2C-methyl-D-erythritol kinase|nr:hypothetical protein [Deltaproteobacteria bacterium]